MTAFSKTFMISYQHSGVIMILSYTAPVWSDHVQISLSRLMSEML